MKSKYSTGLVFIAVIFLVAISGAYQKSYEKTQKQQKEQKEANRIAEEISIATKGNATKEEIYYLKEVDGYVVVYKEDKETIFEVTSIRVEALPEEIKAEVRNEKKIEGTKKLYGFLENYSS